MHQWTILETLLATSPYQSTTMHVIPRFVMLAFVQVLHAQMQLIHLIEALTELLLALVSSKSSLIEPPSSLIIRQDDTSAVGSTDAFLASRLQYTVDDKGQEVCNLKLQDDEQVSVMMGWERGISK